MDKTFTPSLLDHDTQSDRTSTKPIAGDRGIHHNDMDRASDSLDGEPRNINPGSSRKVKRDLQSFHIFFIVLSGVIGRGLFEDTGEILTIAGPGGSMLAIALVGVMVICVMEGLAEMIGHWPISNAMVEFVRAFVDKDLAICVGVAYWYAWSTSFATLIIAAAEFATFWDWSAVGQYVLFIAVIPVIIVCINCMGVKWYGNFEVAGGALKLTLVFGCWLLMCCINAGAGGFAPVGAQYINVGFAHDPAISSNNAIAVLIAIPIITISYCGVEIVAVTALEARNPKELKFPARYIAYITAGIYFMLGTFFYLNVCWQNNDLPQLFGQNYSTNSTNSTTCQGPYTTTQSSASPSASTSGLQSSSKATSQSILIIAVGQGQDQMQVLKSFLNGCLIMTVLSTANTALYVSSRTLYGLTREIDPTSSHWWMRLLSKLSTTTASSQTPGRALIVSALSFCWLPFLTLQGYTSNQDLQEIMSGIATVGTVLVWATQCLAFIRYRSWLKKHQGDLRGDFKQFDHWNQPNNEVPFNSLLAYLQPVLAWIGLIFCLLTCFIFITAGWWNGDETRSGVLSAFAGPAILIGFWLVLKLINRRGWVSLSDDWKDLKTELVTLNNAIDPEVPTIELQNQTHGIHLQLPARLERVFTGSGREPVDMSDQPQQHPSDQTPQNHASNMRNGYDHPHEDNQNHDGDVFGTSIGISTVGPGNMRV